jgi:hypothetical protein
VATFTVKFTTFSEVKIKSVPAGSLLLRFLRQNGAVHKSTQNVAPNNFDIKSEDVSNFITFSGGVSQSSDG